MFASASQTRYAWIVVGLLVPVALLNFFNQRVRRMAILGLGLAAVVAAVWLEEHFAPFARMVARVSAYRPVRTSWWRASERCPQPAI